MVVLFYHLPYLLNVEYMVHNMNTRSRVEVRKVETMDDDSRDMDSLLIEVSCQRSPIIEKTH